MDTDLPEPPRTDTASVDPSRAGYATGVAQPGPAESVSVEKRPSMLAYLLADTSTQQGVNRPGNVDITQPGLVSTVVNPLYQSSLQPVVSVVPTVSGLTVPASLPGTVTLETAARRLPAIATPTPVPTALASATAASAPAFVASQYAAVHTTETLTAQSLLMLGRRTTTPQSSSHSSVEKWLQCTERMPASPLLANSVPSSGYAGLHTTLPVGAEAATLAPRPSPASRSTRRARCSGTSSVAAEFLSFTREMSGHMFGMITQIQNQAQIQYDQSQNQTNQILAQAEMQRVSAEKREEAQRADALKKEEMLIQMKMNTDQVNADREKCQIEANQKMRADTEAANQKREQALLKLKMDSDETTRKREHLFLENELKLQKLLLDANTALNQEKIKADTTKEMASLEALERRELEFQQLQEKEKGH